MSKLCDSTLRCAFSIWRVSMPLSMTSPSRMPAICSSRLRAQRIAEDAHQVVFHRQVEAARARVALASGAAAQLVVDATRFVALGADDVQAAGAERPCRAGSARPRACRSRARSSLSAALGELGLEIAAEDDVGAAAGHVGGNGDRRRAAGLRHDVRLALVLLGIEHLVRHALLVEQPGEVLRRSRSRWCRPAPAARAPRTRGCPR